MHNSRTIFDQYLYNICSIFVQYLNNTHKIFAQYLYNILTTTNSSCAAKARLLLTALVPFRSAYNKQAGVCPKALGGEDQGHQA